jgi:hypothetical protein
MPNPVIVAMLHNLSMQPSINLNLLLLLFGNRKIVLLPQFRPPFVSLYLHAYETDGGHVDRAQMTMKYRMAIFGSQAEKGAALDHMSLVLPYINPMLLRWQGHQ